VGSQSTCVMNSIRVGVVEEVKPRLVGILIDAKIADIRSRINRLVGKYLYPYPRQNCELSPGASKQLEDRGHEFFAIMNG
jgi:hypothetical protein